ncbi:MAG: DUF6714 family protein [Pirellulales bacterium]
MGRTWDGHDVPTLRMHEAAMCFFTPGAFRYYLPAYMLAELRDPENADILGEFVVYQFGEPELDWKETYEKRLTLFTQDEKDAVLAFLRYMQERYGTFAEYVVFAEKQLAGNNGLNPAYVSRVASLSPPKYGRVTWPNSLTHRGPNTGRLSQVATPYPGQRRRGTPWCLATRSAKRRTVMLGISWKSRLRHGTPNAGEVACCGEGVI